MACSKAVLLGLYLCNGRNLSHVTHIEKAWQLFPRYILPDFSGIAKKLHFLKELDVSQLCDLPSREFVTSITGGGEVELFDDFSYPDGPPTIPPAADSEPCRGGLKGEDLQAAFKYAAELTLGCNRMLLPNEGESADSCPLYAMALRDYLANSRYRSEHEKRRVQATKKSSAPFVTPLESQGNAGMKAMEELRVLDFSVKPHHCFLEIGPHPGSRIEAINNVCHGDGPTDVPTVYAVGPKHPDDDRPRTFKDYC